MTIQLPIASETQLGGVMVGEGLDIDGEGLLSVTDYNELKENLETSNQNIEQGKNLLKNTIESKGVAVVDTSFSSLNEGIKNIPTIGNIISYRSNTTPLSYINSLGIKSYALVEDYVIQEEEI